MNFTPTSQTLASSSVVLIQSRDPNASKPQEVHPSEVFVRLSAQANLKDANMLIQQQRIVNLVTAHPGYRLKPVQNETHQPSCDPCRDHPNIRPVGLRKVRSRRIPFPVCPLQIPSRHALWVPQPTPTWYTVTSEASFRHGVEAVKSPLPGDGSSRGVD